MLKLEALAQQKSVVNLQIWIVCSHWMQVAASRGGERALQLSEEALLGFALQGRGRATERCELTLNSRCGAHSGTPRTDRGVWAAGSE